MPIERGGGLEMCRVTPTRALTSSQTKGCSVQRSAVRRRLSSALGSVTQFPHRSKSGMKPPVCERADHRSQGKQAGGGREERRGGDGFLTDKKQNIRSNQASTLVSVWRHALAWRTRRRRAGGANVANASALQALRTWSPAAVTQPSRPGAQCGAQRHA